MRRFTKADKNKLFRWPPPRQVFLCPARDNAGDYRAPLQRVPTSISMELRHRLRSLGACAVRSSKARALLRDRGIPRPKVGGDPRCGFPPSAGRLPYHASSIAAGSRFAPPGMVALIVAQAFGVSARLSHPADRKALVKHKYYYQGTSRFEFRYAGPAESGRELQGEPPPRLESQALLDAFPRNL